MPRYPKPIVALARRTVWRLSEPLVDRAIAREGVAALERAEQSAARLDELTALIESMQKALQAVSLENEVLRKEVLATNHRLSWLEDQAERAWPEYADSGSGHLEE